MEVIETIREQAQADAAMIGSTVAAQSRERLLSDALHAVMKLPPAKRDELINKYAEIEGIVL